MSRSPSFDQPGIAPVYVVMHVATGAIVHDKRQFFRSAQFDMQVLRWVGGGHPVESWQCHGMTVQKDTDFGRATTTGYGIETY